MNDYLACYPRSGSTYLRFLLDINTPYSIGTTHNNGFDKALTTFKNKPQTTIICLKTHYPSSFKKSGIYGLNPTNNNESKIVVLVRNPYDTLMSFKGLKGEQSATDDEVKKFCDDWVKFIKFYKENKDNEVLFVTYEEMTTNPSLACHKIVEFLKYSVSWELGEFQDVTRDMSLERTNKIASHPDQAQNHIGTCSPMFSKKQLYSEKQLVIIQERCSLYLNTFFDPLFIK